MSAATCSTAGIASGFSPPVRSLAKLPERFGLTVHGPGPLRHLDLDLDPEVWGELLYS